MTFDLSRLYLQPAILPGNRHLVLNVGSLPGVKPWYHRVVEYAGDGSVLRSTDLPELPAFRGPKLPETALFGALFPVAARPIVPIWVLDDVFDIRSEEFSHVFDGFMFGSAIVCAALTLLLSRRLGLETDTRLDDHEFSAWPRRRRCDVERHLLAAAGNLPSLWRQAIQLAARMLTLLRRAPAASAGRAGDF